MVIEQRPKAIYRKMRRDRPIHTDPSGRRFLIPRAMALRLESSRINPFCSVSFRAECRNQIRGSGVQRPTPPHGFVQRAQQRYQEGRRDAALDKIYDVVDTRMSCGAFARINDALVLVDVSGVATDILLALLTSTLPAKNRLPSRPAFFEAVKRILVERSEYQDGLLTGLE